MDTLLLGLAFDIFSALCTALNTLFLIFLNLANTSTMVVEITAWDSIKNNIYIILSVIMIFYFTINFLTYLVSPEKLTDKSSGARKTIIRIIISVALLVLTPTVFSLTRDLQTAILHENILGKIIMSNDLKTEDEKYDDQFITFSKTISKTLVSAFITPKSAENNEVNESDFMSTNITSMVDLRDIAINKATHNFNWIMAIAASALLCLLIFGFLFDISIRIIKLMFMELIAPIPILMYPISKKDGGAFSKWLRDCISTYASLFIRLALIYFVLFFIDNLDTEIAEGNAVIYSFIIIGALLFAKQLPDLLKNIFGIKMDGKFTLNPMARIREVPLLGSAVQTVGAAAGGLVTGTALGFRAAGGLEGIKDEFKTYGVGWGLKKLGSTSLKTAGTALMGGTFGMRAGFKQTKLMGVSAKDQKIDKTAYNAGASEVAKAITGNDSAVAGFPDRMFNRIGTELNRPTHDQLKVISDAEKDYDKAVQLLATLKDSEREVYSNMSASIAKKNSLGIQLNEIDENMVRITSTRQERINTETANIDSQINTARTGWQQAIVSGNTESAQSYMEQIRNLETQRTTIEQNVDNQINQEITSLRNQRTTIERQYNEANAIAIDYTNQHAEMHRQVTEQETAVADAKQLVKDEKDRLKQMNGPYHKNK